MHSVVVRLERGFGRLDRIGLIGSMGLGNALYGVERNKDLKVRVPWGGGG